MSSGVREDTPSTTCHQGGAAYAAAKAAVHGCIRDVAQAVLCLASDEASNITGYTLAVTGGR